MAAVTADAAPLPLGLYVHLPWCARKCPYCDFNSHRAPATLPEAAYVDALLADLAAEASAAAGRRVGSVYLGGGTPSLFSPGAVGRLLEGIGARLNLAPDCEITLEANPGTVDGARLAGYRAAGVNRLSLGIQSFDDARLAAIGRIHDGAQARAAVRAARATGFDNLNLDLMYGLPGQDIAGARADLEAALAFGPEHLSAYQLTLEPGTPFHRRPPPLPGADTLADMGDALAEALDRAGYDHYEVSAYARPGGACRHNLNYWTFGDYLAIGAGAHGKLTDRGGVWRYHKPRRPADYLASPRPAGRHRPGPEALLVEFLMNALRLRAGVPAAAFPARTGLAAATLEAVAAPLRDQGLLVPDPARLAPTALGWRHLDGLLARIAAPGPAAAGAV